MTEPSADLIDKSNDTGNRAKNYARALRILKISPPNQRRRSGKYEEERVHKLAVDSVHEEDLTQRNGLLLVAAASNDLPKTIKYLFQKAEWHPDDIKSAIRSACDNDKEDSLASLLKHAPSEDERAFCQLFQYAYSQDNSRMQRTLDNLQNELLGKGWQIEDDHIISYKDTDYGDPSIKTTFNFGACHVRTVYAITGESSKLKVHQKDFEELQSEGELEIAYKKLSQFVANPPQFRGKTTGMTQHRHVPNRKRSP